MTYRKTVTTKRGYFVTYEITKYSTFYLAYRVNYGNLHTARMYFSKDNPLKPLYFIAILPDGTKTRIKL